MMKSKFIVASGILVSFLTNPTSADAAADAAAAADAIVKYHQETDAAAKVAVGYDTKSEAD